MKQNYLQALNEIYGDRAISDVQYEMKMGLKIHSDEFHKIVSIAQNNALCGPSEKRKCTQKHASWQNLNF